MIKMKNTLIILALTAMVGFAFTNAETALDTIETHSIKWLGKKVTGEHSGTIEFDKMDIQFDAAWTLTRANFTVKMATLKDTDMDGENARKLEGHLKSADFFDVENHPISSFKSTGIKSLGDGNYDITGDLTIKDITKPLSFRAQAYQKMGVVGAHAEVKIDRSKYDVKYGSGSFFDGLGDKMIYDEFELTIDISKE